MAMSETTRPMPVTGETLVQPGTAEASRPAATTAPAPALVPGAQPAPAAATQPTPGPAPSSPAPSTQALSPQVLPAQAPSPQAGSPQAESPQARPAAGPARPAAPAPAAGANRPTAAAPAAAPRPLGPAAFRTGDGPEERLIAQVAFALAAEAGPGQQPQTREAVEALRAQASAALSDFAFRYLHNRAEEIRREAAAEAAAGAPRPPGFLALVLANLVALVLAAAAAGALAMNPHLLAGLTGH